MSTPAVPGPAPVTVPPPPIMAARFPSMRTRVSLGSKPRKLGMTAAIIGSGGIGVLVDGRAHLLWQLREQVGCVVNTQFLDVCRPVRVHWIRPNLFRRGNVRASDNNLLNCYPRLASPRPERGLLRLRLSNRKKSHRDDRETEAAVAASLCRGALALLPMAARRHPPSPRFGVAGSAVAITLRICQIASNTLEVLVAVVRSRGLHSGGPNSGTNGSSTAPVDSLANPVTGRRNRRRLRIHRIVVHQVKAVCSWDACKLLPETSESGPSSHGQS